MIDSSWIKLGREWPTLNELLNFHWSTRQQWKDYFRQRARVEFQCRMIHIPEPLDRYAANLQLMRIGPKELDYDNLVGGAKKLIDALRASKVPKAKTYGIKVTRKDGYPERLWGLFADDSPKFLSPTPKYDQLTTANTEDHGTYIKIEWRELEDGKQSTKHTATAP